MTEGSHVYWSFNEYIIMKNKLVIFLVLVIVASCSKYEPITFLKLKDVKVKGIKNGNLDIGAFAIFNNPNKFKGKLKSVNIYVLYLGDTLANVHQVEKLKVAANSTFEVPLSVTVSIKKLQKGLLSNLASLLRKRSAELEFTGNVKVGSFGLTHTIPVKYAHEIEF
jgi:LEA14-like dessication related protein